jgi:hypothetical protein
MVGFQRVSPCQIAKTRRLRRLSQCIVALQPCIIPLLLATRLGRDYFVIASFAIQSSI